VVAVSKTDGTVDVLTGDGVIRLENVQLEGSAPVSPSTLVTSVRTTFGLSRRELLERVQALEAQVAELTRALKQMTSHV